MHRVLNAEDAMTIQQQEERSHASLTPGQYDRGEATMLAHPDDERCPCGGTGWVLSSRDVRYACPAHPGRPDPDDLAADAFCAFKEEEAIPDALRPYTPSPLWLFQVTQDSLSRTRPVRTYE